MSEQPETTPLTFESLQSALVEARDIYYSRADPTWRDVFEVMHDAGYHLKLSEREERYREWIVPVGSHGSYVVNVFRESIAGPTSWTVEVCGFFARRVLLHDPEPAAVLAAAMLTRLLDGPVCGVHVTGLGELTVDQLKQQESELLDGSL